MTINQSVAKRLKAARAALDAIFAKHESINLQMRTVEEYAQPSAQAASYVQSLKQERRGFLARMLRTGEVKTAAPEVWSSTAKAKQLDKKIADAEDDAQRAAAILEAKDAALAELQAEVGELYKHLPAIKRELVEAQFEAATAEIREQALPEFLAACDALQTAYGRLAGLGAAHCEFARELYQLHGVSASSLGTDYPLSCFNIVATGFGLDGPGSMNARTIDASAAIAQAKAEALTR